MPLLEPAIWDEGLRSLDVVLSNSTSKKLDSYRSSAAECLATGLNELGKLSLARGSRDDAGLPNYTRRGVAVAYSLSYMPHRVSSVAGVISLVQDSLPPLSSVVDVGSGSDAVRLALELLDLSPAHFVTTEPSREMTSFGQAVITEWECHTGRRSMVKPQRLGISLEELCQRRYPKPLHGSVDIIILSACLPYRYTNALLLAQSLIDLVRPGGTVLAIEPHAKKSELDSLASAFADLVGERIRTKSSDELDVTFRKSDRLPLCTALLTRYADATVTSGVLEVHGHTLLQKILSSGVLRWLPSSDDFFTLTCPSVLTPRI